MRGVIHYEDGHTYTTDIHSGAVKYILDRVFLRHDSGEILPYVRVFKLAGIQDDAAHYQQVDWVADEREWIAYHYGEDGE